MRDVELGFRPELAVGYTSRSQIARVLTQDWVGREVPCLSCSALPLTPTVQNTKARDFVCKRCSEPYELKSTSRRFGHIVPDGEYHTLRSTVHSDLAPNLLLLEYDALRLSARNLLAVHRSLISDSSIVPRKPLGPTARRAGWQGCGINLELIPATARVPVVEAARPLPWSTVRQAWSRFAYVIQLRPETRGWLRDVLSVVQRLPVDGFTLNDVYRFERELARLHPENQNIQPKIRQQLQLLVAKGEIRRASPGRYARLQSST